MAEDSKNKKEFTGVVMSNKMQDTVRVQVDNPFRHPVYKKVVNKRKIFFAHTDKEIEEGTQVTIRETRAYSKNVKWIVVEK
ncbi:MAG: uS17 family ribosomal protein [Candidatus Dojkabacteria bacterium]|jgi:small subunit ribosomal protein S17